MNRQRMKFAYADGHITRDELLESLAFIGLGEYDSTEYVPLPILAAWEEALCNGN